MTPSFLLIDRFFLPILFTSKNRKNWEVAKVLPFLLSCDRIFILNVDGEDSMNSFWKTILPQRITLAQMFSCVELNTFTWSKSY